MSTHIDCWRICGGGGHRWDYDDYDVERERDRLDFPCKYNMHIYIYSYEHVHEVSHWSENIQFREGNELEKEEGEFKPLKKI